MYEHGPGNTMLNKTENISAIMEPTQWVSAGRTKECFLRKTEKQNSKMKIKVSYDIQRQVNKFDNILTKKNVNVICSLAKDKSNRW